MVPASFSNYFLASVGASAALIGLLFVAITVAPEQVFGDESTIARRAMAGGAFLALINTFFVSLTALVPGANIGYVAVVVSVVALVNTASLGWRIWMTWHRRRDAESVLLIVGSLIIYGAEIRYGLPLILHGKDTAAMTGLVYLLLSLFGLGVARSWVLLGGGQDGLMALFGFSRSRHADRPDNPATAGQPSHVTENSKPAK